MYFISNRLHLRARNQGGVSDRSDDTQCYQGCILYSPHFIFVTYGLKPYDVRLIIIRKHAPWLRSSLEAS